MTHFQAFDSFDEMMEAERKAQELALVEHNKIPKSVQDFFVVGAHFAKIEQEYDMVVFGTVLDPNKDAYTGKDVSPEEREEVPAHMRWCRSHSVMDPEGELGHYWIIGWIPITQTAFELAEESGWSVPPQIFSALCRDMDIIPASIKKEFIEYVKSTRRKNER
jgi:hypothetical protein